MMFSYFKKRKEQKERDLYEKGFSCVMVMYFLEDCSYEEIEAKTYCFGDDWNTFDDGVKCGLNQIWKLEQAKGALNE